MYHTVNLNTIHMKSISYTLKQFVEDKPFKDNSILVMDCPDSAYKLKYIMFAFTNYEGFVVKQDDGTYDQYRTRLYIDLGGESHNTTRYTTIGVNGKQSSFRLPTSEEIEIFKNAFPNEYQSFNANQSSQNTQYEIY